MKRVAGFPPPKEEDRGVDHSHWRQAEIPWSSQPQQNGRQRHRYTCLDAVLRSLLRVILRANNGVPRSRRHVEL
jgi:hypothetical protein